MEIQPLYENKIIDAPEAFAWPETVVREHSDAKVDMDFQQASLKDLEPICKTEGAMRINRV